MQERESEAVELCSVVTGAESKNSNLVITAHYCLHGNREGVGVEAERDADDFHSRRNSSLLKQHLNHLTPAASTANYRKICCTVPETDHLFYVLPVAHDHTHAHAHV